MIHRFKKILAAADPATPDLATPDLATKIGR